MSQTLETIVICGRSEAALRMERTCRRLGIEVFDGGADQDNPLLPDAESLVARAKEAGAQAILPGFVAPRSRAEIAMLARAEGMVFVGPSSESLALMADKLALRARLVELDVHVVPGSERAVADVDDALREADRLEYPVVVKPVAGAGGIGIDRADDEDELPEAFARATAEAAEAFDDARVYLEREIFRPRQIEMTVIADDTGALVTTGERESSIQRGGRALLSEMPSPYLASHPEGESIRELMVEIAHRLARALSLKGAITFEVLLDPDGHVHFLDANADMQAGVLATEMLTGIDPIQLFLDLARGEPVVDPAKLVPSGHAFDVKLCAERTDGTAAGTVEELRFPPAPQGKVRVEPNIDVGDELPRDFEAVLARIATFAPGRHDALLSLDRTLAETSLGGIATNVGFLRRVLNDESFRAGQYDIRFTDRLGA